MEYRVVIKPEGEILQTCNIDTRIYVTKVAYSKDKSTDN